MNFNTQLSEKENFRFNEVTSLVEVKPYVLRFWESEFEQIKPIVDQSGEKLYGTKDLEHIKRIRDLLFDQKCSIPEAKSRLDQEIKNKEEKLRINKISSGFCEVKQDGQNSDTVSLQQSSLELMKQALEKDLQERSQDCKQTAQGSLSHKDIVHLVHAKKKLTSVLNLIHDLSGQRDW